MVNHLTNDQISRWIAGQTTAAETRHLQSCGECAIEIDHFLQVLGTFRSTLTAGADHLTARRDRSSSLFQSLQETSCGNLRTFGLLLEAPSLWTSLRGAVVDALSYHKTETRVTPIDVPEIWSPHRLGFSRWLSVGLHVLTFGALALPAVLPSSLLPSPQLQVTTVETRTPLVLNLPSPGQSAGGGGGGVRAPEPPSRGVPPRAADRQLVPPAVEARNLFPDFVVESTVVAPSLNMVQALNIPIGDPNGVVGPPSAGPGTGGGIGTGQGTGVGPGRGPGVGPGSGGGVGGGVFSVGGGVSEPILLSREQPEYSDDARKARIQGTVELVIIVDADGKVRFDSVHKSLGYGLDQKAIDAVTKWLFQPALKDGKAVPVYVSVVVNFTLR